MAYYGKAVPTLAIALLSLLMPMAFTQQKMSCCSKPATKATTHEDVEIYAVGYAGTRAGYLKGAIAYTGKDGTIKMYDAVPGFANPSNPKHNKPATKEAHKLAVDFLKKHFKQALFTRLFYCLMLHTKIGCPTRQPILVCSIIKFVVKSDNGPYGVL